MPYGWLSMFDINLLQKPGLQEILAEPEWEVVPGEAEIISRLEARAPTVAPIVAAPKPREKSRFRSWMVIVVVVLIVAAYWWYQGWSWRQFREAFPFREVPSPADVRPAVTFEEGTCAAVVTNFLLGLPSRAAIDFMDAGAGMLIYRVWGQELAQPLLQLNASIEGHQFSDLLMPVTITGPDYWYGIVTFNSRDQAGALRPVRSEYDRFFRLLQDRVRDTGGDLVEMVPGTMTAGEYVIRATLDEIQAHLATVSSDSTAVHYHRLSLLSPDGLDSDFYLLRVIFNLIEEPTPSPQLSSPGSTGV